MTITDALRQALVDFSEGDQEVQVFDECNTLGTANLVKCYADSCSERENGISTVSLMGLFALGVEVGRRCPREKETTPFEQIDGPMATEVIQ